MTIHSIHCLRAIACLFSLVPLSATAASLQFTIKNLAPAGSVAFLPGFQPVSAQNVTNVTLVSAEDGFADVLPRLVLLSGLGGAGAQFPLGGGAVVFPELLPGEVLSFSLENVDLTAESIFYQGIALFGEVPLADGNGNFIGADFALTAGAIAEFDNSGAVPLLILPDSGVLGPESITPATLVLGISVIPEPSVTLLSAAGIVLFLRRRRSPSSCS